ncbi:hypothetical protein [uncultured Campylobacter sp.]|uniref:DUF6985 domain-containing protein n=1 Tax=uncultured Campylobacter sp. TaxID=218934 RepID=UPI002620D898|nr:hypothetical protein [uncultured Campylobacter sp.]
METDDEKNRVYASYIYAARMVNEYKWAGDASNMLCWLNEMDKHARSNENPPCVSDYYKGECCLECGAEQEALKFLRKSYEANEEYLFTRSPKAAEFFNARLAEPKIFPKFEDEEYEDFGFPLRLEYFGKALEQEGEFHCAFLDEDGEETDEPSRMHSNAIEFLKQNQEEILTGILAEILKNYPKWQEIYDYPSGTKSDFMPGISTPQELSELLELQNIYILDSAKIGFEFSCSWDMEHDLDIMTRKGEVINIGEAEVAFMAI